MTKQNTLKGMIREVAYSKRMFALLILLIKQKVVTLTRASKMFSGSHVHTMEAVRKLKAIYDLDIEIFVRKKGGVIKFLILR